MCLEAKADGDTAERNGTTLTRSKYVSSRLWSIGQLNTYEAVVITADGVGLARRATSSTDDGDGGAGNTNEATEVVSGDSEGTEEASNGGAIRLEIKGPSQKGILEWRMVASTYSLDLVTALKVADIAAVNRTGSVLRDGHGDGGQNESRGDTSEHLCDRVWFAKKLKGG